MAQDLGVEHADVGAIIQVLRGLHIHPANSGLPVDVLRQESSASSLRVKVLKDIEAEELELLHVS